MEFFTTAVTVDKDRHWNAFMALLRLWPKPSETLSEALHAWRLEPPPPKITAKPTSETMPARLQAMCMQASDWAAKKLRAGDGWSALLMVVDRDGQSSATIYQEDSWEAAEKLARKELTSGHYDGNLMYVLARHVSWAVRGEDDCHAILMQVEARDRCTPVLLSRHFTETNPERRF